MRRTPKLFALISICALLASSSLAQAPTQHVRKQALAPAAGSNPVVGSGTPGRSPTGTGVGHEHLYGRRLEHL